MYYNPDILSSIAIPQFNNFVDNFRNIYYNCFNQDESRYLSLFKKGNSPKVGYEFIRINNQELKE